MTDYTTMQIPYLSDSVNDTINALNKIITNMKLSDIMNANPNESIVPVNLWFENDDYCIRDVYESNKHNRLRIFKGSVLSPVVIRENGSIDSNPVLNEMPFFQPFYPETFFNGWELMSTVRKLICGKKKLYIGYERNMGLLEAAMVYDGLHDSKTIKEPNLPQEPPCTYDTYITSNNYNKLNVPAKYIDYLGQMNNIEDHKYLHNLSKYNSIIIDCCSQFKSFFSWDCQFNDLRITMFFFFKAIRRFDSSSSSNTMIIKLNLLCSVQWKCLIDLFAYYFESFDVIRCSLSHPLNSEAYLVGFEFRNVPVIGEYFSVVDHYPITNEPMMYGNALLNLFKKRSYDWGINALNAFKYNIKADWCKSFHISKIGSLMPFTDRSNVVLTFSKYQSMTIVVKINCFEPIFFESIKYRLISYNPSISLIRRKKLILDFYKKAIDAKPGRVMTSKYENDPNSYFYQWEDIMNEIDHKIQLKKIITKKCKAEMVTNAWMKMIELADIADLKQFTSVNSFHLCEAPGAFIYALNHYFDSHGMNKWKWWAQSLKPNETNHALNETTKMYDKWIYGDNNGDLTDVNTIKYYRQFFSNKKINLMTSDGGIQMDPKKINDQEIYTIRLFMGQVICVLACLEKGGTAIIKTFLPLCENLSVSLCYILANAFDKMMMVKPSTSHPDNSEIYLVLMNYKGRSFDANDNEYKGRSFDTNVSEAKGISEMMLDALMSLMEQDISNLHAAVIVDFFTSKHLADTDRFTKEYSSNVITLINRQIDALASDQYYYYNYPSMPPKFNCDDWIAKHGLKQLSKRLS